MKTKLYHYKAYVTKVYDGDTITVDLDLGMKIVMHDQKIRLYGIDTPELRGSDEEKAKGIAARDFLRGVILHKEVIIETHKDRRGKFGRLLGTIWALTEMESYNMNALLIARGHAVEYKP